MSVVVITPPAAAPVTLAMAKAQCRAREFDTDDDLLQLYVDSATQWLDGPAGWLGRCLMPQTLELRLASFDQANWRSGDRGDQGLLAWEYATWWERGWPFAGIRLPFPPLIGVTSITFEDNAGADQGLDPSGWALTSDGVRPAFGDVWPTGRIEANAVRIRYQAGYPLAGGIATVPAPIRQAILLMVSHFYAHPDAVVGVDNRDSSAPLPLGVEDLLTPFRIWA